MAVADGGRASWRVQRVSKQGSQGSETCESANAKTYDRSERASERPSFPAAVRPADSSLFMIPLSLPTLSYSPPHIRIPCDMFRNFCQSVVLLLAGTAASAPSRLRSWSAASPRTRPSPAPPPYSRSASTRVWRRGESSTVSVSNPVSCLESAPLSLYVPPAQFISAPLVCAFPPLAPAANGIQMPPVPFMRLRWIGAKVSWKCIGKSSLGKRTAHSGNATWRELSASLKAVRRNFTDSTSN